MRKLMIIALAAAAVTAWSSTDSIAQDYQNSYRFGVGLGYGTQFGDGIYNGSNRFARRGIFNRGFGNLGIVDRVEAPPYFAQYPPVYYNGIVARPYGVSPYAAPPGIMPIEMTIPHVVEPQAIHNPYFDQPVAPVSEQPTQPGTETTDNKTTHVVNPYTESLTRN